MCLLQTANMHLEIKYGCAASEFSDTVASLLLKPSNKQID